MPHSNINSLVHSIIAGTAMQLSFFSSHHRAMRTSSIVNLATYDSGKNTDQRIFRDIIVVHWGCGDNPRADHACSERGLYGRPPGGNRQRVRAR